MKRILLTALIALCCITGASKESYGAGKLRRADCFKQGTAANMGRLMGDRNARRISQAMWARLGQTCDQVDRLAQIISETPLARPYQGGDFAACFYLGYTDGLWDELDKTYTRCGDKCFSAGAEMGHISAQGYCYASVALGGLLDPGFIAQPPLPFCGQNIVIGCKSEYVYTAMYDIPGCYEFTVGQFTETFDNSVRLDCYVPWDIPIRDGNDFLNAAFF